MPQAREKWMMVYVDQQTLKNHTARFHRIEEKKQKNKKQRNYITFLFPHLFQNVFDFAIL